MNIVSIHSLVEQRGVDIEFPVEQLQLEVGLTLTHSKDPTGQGGAEAEGEVVASCVVVKGY